MILVHVHIPRTGGASLSEAIRAVWPGPGLKAEHGKNVFHSGFERYSIEPNDPEVGPADQFYIALANEVDKVENDVYIYGHFPYGIHKYLKSPVFYITMLRDPAYRAWSRFNTYRDAIQYKIHHAWKHRYNFEIEKILAANEPELCNDQTRMIIGTKRKVLTDADADLAIEMLQTKYSYASVTERLNDLQPELCKIIGIPTFYMSKINIGYYPWAGKRLTEDMRSLIEPYNKLDRKVYEFVKSKQFVGTGGLITK